MNWQPIETAPKDKLILVGRTKRMDMCTAVNHSQDGWVTETPAEWISIYTPSHWMPLPAAPGLSEAVETVSLPAKEWSAMAFWLGRCEDKGHLENCSDLVEPWEELQAAIQAMDEKESP